MTNKLSSMLYVAGAGLSVLIPVGGSAILGAEINMLLLALVAALGLAVGAMNVNNKEAVSFVILTLGLAFAGGYLSLLGELGGMLKTAVYGFVAFHALAATVPAFINIWRIAQK